MFFCIPIPSLLYHFSTFSLPLTCITHAQISLLLLLLLNLFLLIFLLHFWSLSVISHQAYLISNLHVLPPCYHFSGETVFLHIFHIKWSQAAPHRFPPRTGLHIQASWWLVVTSSQSGEIQWAGSVQRELLRGDKYFPLHFVLNYYYLHFLPQIFVIVIKFTIIALSV